MKAWWTLLAAYACYHVVLSVGDPPGISTIDMVARMPPDIDWSSFVEKLPALGRVPVVSVPCTGILSSSHAWQSMHQTASYVNIFDLERRYRSCLTEALQRAGMTVQDIELNLRLGKTSGDLLMVPLNAMQRKCDFLIAGPPCPPWAGSGNRKGTKDARAKVFVRIMQWVHFMVAAGGLLVVILENVSGMMHSHDGREAPITQFLNALREYIPSFVWGVDQLALQNYMCPQKRVRVFLRGVRRSICETLPPILPAFGKRTLLDILGKYPNTTRASMRPTIQENVLDYEKTIRDMVSKGTLDLKDVVVVAADRAAGKAWNQAVQVNAAPTLTTNNFYLLVLSVSCVVESIADESRKYFRWLTGPERLALQSLPSSLFFELGGDLAVKAAGNAYPPVLIMAATHGILKALSNFDLKAWPPEHELAVSNHNEQSMKLFTTALMRPGPKTARGKAQARAKAKAQARVSGAKRRSHSSDTD